MTFYNPKLNKNEAHTELILLEDNYCEESSIEEPEDRSLFEHNKLLQL